MDFKNTLATPMQKSHDLGCLVLEKSYTPRWQKHFRKQAPRLIYLFACANCAMSSNLGILYTDVCHYNSIWGLNDANRQHCCNAHLRHELCTRSVNAWLCCCSRSKSCQNEHTFSRIKSKLTALRTIMADCWKWGRVNVSASMPWFHLPSYLISAVRCSPPAYLPGNKELHRKTPGHGNKRVPATLLLPRNIDTCCCNGMLPAPVKGGIKINAVYQVLCTIASKINVTQKVSDCQKNFSYNCSTL